MAYIFCLLVFWKRHIMQTYRSISQWNAVSVSSNCSLCISLSQYQLPSGSIFFPSYKNWLAEVGMSLCHRKLERSDLSDHQSNAFLPCAQEAKHKTNKQINAKQNKTKSRIVNRFAQDATAIWGQSQSWNSKYWWLRLEDFVYCLLPWWQSFIKYYTFMWCRYSNISIILYNTSVKLGTNCLMFGHLTFLDNSFTLHVVYKQCSFL